MISSVFENLWSIHEPFLRKMLRTEATPGRLDSALRLEIPSSRAESIVEVIEDDVALITIDGPLTKRESVWQILFGGASYFSIEAALDAARENAAIGSAVVWMDSPGGEVDGIQTAADAIDRFAAEKPIATHVEGMAASAAYYLAARTGAVFAEKSLTMIGSIGTRMMLYDLSKAFEDAGYKAIPIDTGFMKSAGAEGTVITDEQKKEFQRIIDRFFDEFVAAVADGRGMSSAAVRTLADGRVFFAEDGLKNGLVDGVQSLAATVAYVKGQTMEPKTKPATTPAAKPATTPDAATPQPATLRELKASFPNSTAEFREACIEDGSTITEASTKWIAKVDAENAELRKAATEREAEAKAPATGVEPIGTGAESKTAASDAEPIWDELVAKYEKQLGSRQRAVARAVRDHPEAHYAFVTAYNEKNKRDASAFRPVPA